MRAGCWSGGGCKYKYVEARPSTKNEDGGKQTNLCRVGTGYLLRFHWLVPFFFFFLCVITTLHVNIFVTIVSFFNLLNGCRRLLSLIRWDQKVDERMLDVQALKVRTTKTFMFKVYSRIPS